MKIFWLGFCIVVPLSQFFRNPNMKTRLIFGALLAIASMHSANATLIGVGGNGAIIAAPTSVADDAPGAETPTDTQFGFDEQQNVLLGSALSINGGSIAAGTVVSSHMIFLNTAGTVFGGATARWVFDGVILGVMSDSGGTLEAASSALLGASGTFYPGAFAARGLEGGDSYSFAAGSNILSVTMQVTEPGDWIRVITAARAVPEPGTLGLLGIGLLGVGGLRRRRG